MRIVESMFHCIDRLARSDEKHGDRLRLENYSYFDQSVGPLARHVAALSKYCNDAIPLMVMPISYSLCYRAFQEESLRKYVQQQLEYGRLWGILDFSNKIETELREVSPQEISFKAGFSAQDLRTLISQTMASPDKKLSMMYTRVKKHLGESSPKLLYTVWQSVEAEVLNRYRKLEQQMMDCYPNIQLSPSPEELAELFKTTGPGT